VRIDADRQAQADAALVLFMPVGSHASGAGRFLAWWQALHPSATQALTPFERRSSCSAPGPDRARALHATTTERTTRPNARNTRAKSPQPPDPTAGLPPLNRTAAGIDVGSAEPEVAVPPERAPAPGRRWASCTADRQAWADGLHAGHLHTGVMASPGVSGIPLVHILAARGFAVPLVNARHANTLPGRTTDLADRPWRPPLHPFGRLHSSWRPPDAIGG
jgi:hypothetical protein